VDLYLLFVAVVSSTMAWGAMRAFRALGPAFSPAAWLDRSFARGTAALRAARYERAESFFRRAVMLAEQQFGTGHWRTAQQVAMLATAVAAQDRLDEAEDLLARALAAQPAAASTVTAAFANVYVQAAIVAAKRKDPSRQLEMLREGRVFALAGAPGLLALIDLQQAAVLLSQGDEAGAAALVRDVDLAYVPDSEAARAGRLRLRGGDADGAVMLLRRAVQIERTKADVSGNLALLRSLVAEALEAAGRHAEARVALTMALDTYEAVSAPAVVIVPLLVRLARIELSLGNPPAARSACERALAGAPSVPRAAEPYREASGEQDPLVASRVEAQRLLTVVTRGDVAVTPAGGSTT
jgi:tetratricopeptide (TPR) repeat protein